MVVPSQLQLSRNANPASNRYYLDAFLLLAWATLVIAVIVLFFGLIPGGRWQTDEYTNFALYRDTGAAFWPRLTHFSPRPVSEFLLYLYARLVVASGKPHITVALAAFWAILIITIGLGACPFGRGKTRRGLVAGSVVALFLLYNPSGQMFYWPFGAAAYLPGIAGLGLFTLVFVWGPDHWRVRQIVGSAGLILAACSVEAGAMAVLAVTGSLGAVAVARLRFQGVVPRLLWLIIPAATAALVLCAFAIDRVLGKPPDPAAVVGSGAYKDIARSLIAPLGNIRELVGLPPNGWPGAVLLLALAWLGLVFCFRQSQSRTGSRRVPELLAVAAALLIAAYLILASSYFVFGEPCCSRHESFRGCLMVLMVVLLAAAAAERGASWLAPLRSEACGPALLSAALLFGLWRQSGALTASYHEIPLAIAVRSENWEAGQKPGHTMTFTILPASTFFRGDDVSVRGSFVKSRAPWFIHGIFLYFKKDEIDFKEPSTPNMRLKH